jgi:penicillin G amidase
LASDPHLGLTAPTIWYLARLELQSGAVIGGTIPGTPAVLVGRSDTLGWGLTTAYLDDQDVLIEELNPENTEEYRTPDGWATFESRQSIITVKDAAPVTLTLRWSRNGPILPGTHYELASITPGGHVAALSWTALNGADTSMTAALRLMRPKDVAAAIEAGRLVVAPAQNLMLADLNGIAMQVVGQMPARDPAHPSQGADAQPGCGPGGGLQGHPAL